MYFTAPPPSKSINLIQIQFQVMFHMCRCSSVRWKPKSTPPAQSCLIPIPYVSNPNPVADLRLSCSLMDLGWVWSRSKEENHGLQIKRSTIEEKEWKWWCAISNTWSGLDRSHEGPTIKKKRMELFFFNKNLVRFFAWGLKLRVCRNVPKCSGIYLSDGKVKGVVLPLPLPWQYFE